jgi:hypothetical protein
VFNSVSKSKDFSVKKWFDDENKSFNAKVIQKNNTNPVDRTSLSIQDYKLITFSDLPFHNFS